MYTFSCFSQLKYKHACRKNLTILKEDVDNNRSAIGSLVIDFESGKQ